MSESRGLGSRRGLGRLMMDGTVALALVAVLLVVYARDRGSRAIVASAPPVHVPSTERKRDWEAVIPPPPLIEPPPIVEAPADLPPTPPAPPAEAVMPNPDAAPVFDPTHRIVVGMTGDARFGVSTLAGNPDDPTDDNKLLTFSEQGGTNNTRVLVNGDAPLFASGVGRVLRDIHRAPDGERIDCAWSFKLVSVHQLIEVIPGEISKRMDTIRVTYTLKNESKGARQVGLRVMLDTLIGRNDGVPFIVPGRKGIVTSPLELRGEEVPDFVRSLETDDLANPGVIVDIGLRPIKGERPSQVVLTHWPGHMADWNYDRLSPFGKDSAVGLYYDPKPLGVGQTREMSFTYGLGTISSTRTKNASLSLTAGGPFKAGGKFWLVVLVQHPKSGQRVRVTLPQGLSLEKPTEDVQTVPEGSSYTQLSWLVAAAPNCFGDREIKASLEPGTLEERQTLSFKPREAQLSLVARGPFQACRPFWVCALVRHPQNGQSVELSLPAGFALGPKETLKKDVGTGGEFVQLRWLVVAAPQGRGTQEIKAVLQPGAVEERQSLTLEPVVTRLTLSAQEPFRTGRPFWLSALVQNPTEGQTLTLTLPTGLTLGPKEVARKIVPSGAENKQINWLVQVDNRVSGRQQLAVALEPGSNIERKFVEIEAGNLIR